MSTKTDPAPSTTSSFLATDRCDRCGARAYVRVTLANNGELLFCAHHRRLHAAALDKVAVDITDETASLSEGTEPTG